VFHLMRVLEIGLCALANRFGVPSDRANWNTIIERIEKALRDMPDDPNRKADWKEDQEFYSKAASHFMFVKDAWRNHAMHRRAKYTDEEAKTLLMNVRAFMAQLALKLSEPEVGE